MGGTKVLGVALVDDELIAEERVATPAGAADMAADDGTDAAAELADALARVVDALRSEVGAASRAAPVGLGIPGMVDRLGVLRFAPNLKAVAGSDVRATASARMPGVQLVVENDASCAALAEARTGAARGASRALVVTLGTGIGGGVVAGGRVEIGARGFAGEIGHMVVDPAGPPCPCGRRGCWERFASGGGLGRLAREAAYAGHLGEVVASAGGDPELVRGEHVTDAARRGEPGAIGVIEELGWWVALGLANLTAVLDPDVIVVGGGLAQAGELLLAPTRRAFAEVVEGGVERPEVAIVAAEWGERAGAVGAAMAALAGGL